MSKSSKDTVVYESTKTIVLPDGELLSSVSEQKVRRGDEPDFVKLYINFVLSTKELSQSLNPILLAFISYMSYANTDNPDGGQVIYINSAMKNDICKKLNNKIDRVNQSLQQFKKAGILKSLERGKYQVNPSYFGRGDWKDIKAIRGKFDFSQDGAFIEDVEIEKNNNEEIV